MRISVHRVIKLLTLVQDSSIEQKLELFPLAKVRNYLATSKKNVEKLFLQLFLQFTSFCCNRRIWIVFFQFV